MTIMTMMNTPSHDQGYPAQLPTASDFDVVDAFSRLDTGRKMSLFDHLMANRLNAYKNTLKSFWPAANEDDARKLEIVLRARLNRLKGAF
jgi:hypothetical protein